MRRDEYRNLIKDISDPYSAWIREKEIKREVLPLRIPDDYTLFLDGDGDIDPGLSAALNEYGVFEKGYDFIYADEDEISGNRRHDPFFKPAFSPDTLEDFYYPGGFTIVKNSLIRSISGKTAAEEGSLEFLRECGRASEKPLHIPEVMYHAGTHHKYAYKDAGGDKEAAALPDRVSVVILSKDHPELLRRCISGLRKSAEKDGISPECIVLDNGSNAENTACYQELSKEYSFSYLREERDFVFSALCNKGASLTESGVLLFLNDDIEVPDGLSFLKPMMRETLKPGTGAVGCKLLYPGGEKIQHIGISMLSSGGSHCFSGYSDDVSYMRGVNRGKRNVFAVTGACLMVERSKFLEAGGFDEKLAVAYTDTDLCAALLSKGYRNVCLNSFFLIHHESVSRKSDAGEREKYLRLRKERDYFYGKYRELLKDGDPWYNRNLTGTELDMRVDILYPEDRVPFYSSEALKKADSTVKGCRKAEEGQVLYNIESVSVRNSDAQGHEGFIDIRGWGFVHGKAGYEYDICVKIKDSDREYVLTAGRIYREDLPQVFPKEKDILLSGFAVKAEAAALKSDITKDSIALIFRGHDIFGRDRSFIINES
ncbi:MAG: glycosyltransferase [Lachnospiraceae bacterium]|nr:glycosyltransferase [Lachnospiraceae bacterium]